MRYGSMLLILAAMLLGVPSALQAAPLPVPGLALTGPDATVHRAFWPFRGMFGRRRQARRHGVRRGRHADVRRTPTGRGSAEGGGQKLRFH